MAQRLDSALKAKDEELLNPSSSMCSAEKGISLVCKVEQIIEAISNEIYGTLRDNQKM